MACRPILPLKQIGISNSRNRDSGKDGSHSCEPLRSKLSRTVWQFTILPPNEGRTWSSVCMMKRKTTGEVSSTSARRAVSLTNTQKGQMLQALMRSNKDQGGRRSCGQDQLNNRKHAPTRSWLTTRGWRCHQAGGPGHLTADGQRCVCDSCGYLRASPT